MSVVTRFGSLALLVSLIAAGPALAQGSEGTTSWSDPPVRGSAAPVAPVKPAETPAAASSSETKAPEVKAAGTASEAKAPETKAAAAPAATPAQRAAALLGVKPVVATPRSAGRQAWHPFRRPLGHSAVGRPYGSRVVERTRWRAAASPRSSRAWREERRAERAARRLAASGNRRHVYETARASRRLSGWSGLIDDNPVSRIARARESGHLLMRLRTYQHPDGSLTQRLVPFDDDGFGDSD